MGYRCEGTIEIPLEQFWEYAVQFMYDGFGETVFGVPRTNIQNQTIEIDFVENTNCHPTEEMDEPEILSQWRTRKKD